MISFVTVNMANKLMNRKDLSLDENCTETETVRFAKTNQFTYILNGIRIA